MRRKTMPTWLVWFLGACGLLLAVLDHPFLRGTASTVVLICAVMVVLVAVVWDRWSRP